MTSSPPPATDARPAGPIPARHGRIALTGATGYVGGRLLERLQQLEHPVRCLSRHPERLAGRITPSTDAVGTDVLNTDQLAQALDGVDAAYYLVHSMGSSGSFAEIDRRGAASFAAAAARAGVRRIVYLGGLGHEERLSDHLASRHEVGAILRSGPVETVEFRASVIIGSGSLSFEMVRALVDRLPVMVTPRWVATPSQPIAIEDVLDYLIAALDLPAAGSRIYEIGGADVVTYGELMREYAAQRGLRRHMIPVPLLTPRLSGLWLSLVTPLYAQVGRKLVDGVQNRTVVRDSSALRDFPIRPRGVPDAIASAIRFEDRAFAQTRWSDAAASEPHLPRDKPPRLIDTRTVWVPASPDHAFAPIRRIGGASGWYAVDRLWHLRGLIDQLVGGVGLRRGRRDPEQVAPGDTLDFWRVERYEPDYLLRLRAEMRLPGRAWLEFEATPEREGTRIRQTAQFDPAGAAGRLYWYALLPIHAAIFQRMLKSIAAHTR
ncbi:MAG TPA: SDR family oxidoreductase [Gaiellales bacterium]|jgi:uncharacterized protein YbjT (DUF2867 family)|nr:SDR family oxidoreductase [Gaiellales bacterium]